MMVKTASKTEDIEPIIKEDVAKVSSGIELYITLVVVFIS
jgi:hypothetical protein